MAEKFFFFGFALYTHVSIFIKMKYIRLRAKMKNYTNQLYLFW